MVRVSGATATVSVDGLAGPRPPIWLSLSIGIHESNTRFVKVATMPYLPKQAHNLDFTSCVEHGAFTKPPSSQK